MSIEIKTVGGKVLYTAESAAADVRAAVTEAVAAKANLYGADLRGADLYGADLYGANLRGAKNADLVIARTRIIPDEGPVIGWKKCFTKSGGELIVKLLIPGDAKRSHASGRKCRAERAEVLAITDLDGNPVGEAFSGYDEAFRYAVGAVVVPGEPFCEDMWQECASGIHFFVTRLEAVAHV
jgi:hypothetical protein